MSDYLTVRVRDQAHGVEEEYELRKPYAIVGTGPGSDIPLSANGETPARRVYLQAVAEGVVAVELASHKQPQQGAPAAARLTSEQNPLIIGPYSVTVTRRPGESGTSLVTAPSPPSLKLPNRPLDDLWLYFINGHSRTRKKSRRPLRETLTLMGGSQRCHLKLSHPEISQFQCSVVRTAESLSIVSLSRRSPLRVNGHPVLYSRLSVGDVLSLGPFRLQLQHGQRHDSSAQFNLPQSAGLQQPTDSLQPEAPKSDESSANPLPDRAIMPSRNGQLLSAADETQELSSEWDTVRCSSDSDIISLVEQFAAVQQILMAQSQQQTAMLLHVIGHMQSNQSGQDDLLREQIAAVQGISNELQAWRAELNGQQANGNGSVVQPQPVMPRLPLDIPSIPPSTPLNEPPPPREPKSPEDIQTHASLSERITFLERERNGLLQKIMRLLPSGNGGV